MVWEDPGGGRGRPGACPITEAQRKELAANPNRWARVKNYDKPTSATSAAGRIKKGLYREMPEGEWEAAARRNGGGERPVRPVHLACWIYAAGICARGRGVTTYGKY
ncbi:MAG TPA: hypothetical protein VJM75_09180 [Acidimicrobiales bacterium]|nr:hypothetical protein [Acidimicrobiales bacterium]